MKLVRSFSFCVVILGWAFSGPSSAVHAAEKPLNVLFIAVDDLRPELGCYGVSDAQSPCFDAFAETAVRFNNHFVQVPTCGASRYAMLTGQSPFRSGVTSNNAALYQGSAKLTDVAQAGAQSMPELFRRSGYQTVCIGKISHTADGRVYEYNGKGDGHDEVPLAWDKLATPLGAWKRGWGVFFAYPGGVHREDGQGHQDLLNFTVTQDTDLPDGLMAQSAIDFLSKQRDTEVPFFLVLGSSNRTCRLLHPSKIGMRSKTARFKLPRTKKSPRRRIGIAVASFTDTTLLMKSSILCQRTLNAKRVAATWRVFAMSIVKSARCSMHSTNMGWPTTPSWSCGATMVGIWVTSRFGVNIRRWNVRCAAC
ncbi:iduronate-2-sulfatase [Rhodopirellula maiorica SM1]|uniref:Iduronate-2-sulfatase n=1 Tax=Rhodopirellula maiorica SM1 TaxID=1265738 RepID=M5RZX0_9BACT|nr:iduronate-2-sulfatase [Rhodopirellula maiorica SM1]